jgi:type I restriction enzyme S subunit
MIPKGWEVKRLDYILDIKYGKDHKKLESGNIPVYGSGGIMRYVNQFLYDQDSILIPRKGTLSSLFFLTTPFWSVDTMFYSKIKQQHFGKYVFYFLKTVDLASMDVGSAVPSLTTELLNRIDILMPPILEIERFDNEVTSYFKVMEANVIENQTLAILRDTLLPKLISGEVRVKEAEKALVEVL